MHTDDMSTFPKLMPTKPGDVLSFAAQISSNDGKQVTFCISNQTTGVSTGNFIESTAIPCSTDPNPGPTENNNQVEWITEKNGLSLAQYGTVEMSSCLYGYGNPGINYSQPGMVATNPYTLRFICSHFQVKFN